MARATRSSRPRLSLKSSEALASSGSLQRDIHLPLVQEQPGALLVQLGAVARQILGAVEDRHHRQQKGIARELADGGGIFDGAGEARAFRLALRGVLVGAAMPAGEEVADLRLVQFLQHELAEALVAPGLVLIADDA